MKFRAALAALLLLVPATANSKVMVVFDNTTTSSPEETEYYERMDRRADALGRIFADLGVDAVVVPRKVAKTTFCATGAMVWNYGTAGARVEQFDAVIHVGFNGRALSYPSGVAPNYRPDSMTVGGATNAPTVPQLFLLSAGLASAAPGPTDGTADTSGIQEISSISACPTLLRRLGSTRGFMGAAHIAWYRLNPTPPAGGIRKLVVGDYSDNLLSGGMERALLNASNAPWWDSTSSVSDTAGFVAIWERPMAHVSGAKPIVFAQAFGASVCFDSTGAYQPCEWNADVVVMALARLDSLTGGRVFSKNKLPKKSAIAIYGGFSRSDSRYQGADPARGIDPAYIENTRTTRDSLRGLGVPFTLGVNLDSVSTYIADKAMWDSAGPGIRYAISNYGGLDSAAASGAASWLRPRDAWGRFRNRVAVGPVNGASPAAADTSIYALLKASLFRMDSLFSGRVSRVALAPFDDWTPKNVRGMGNGVDSVLLAARLAGLTGVVVDAQRREADPARIAAASIDLVRGWRTTQGSYQGVRLLAHTGFAVNAGRTQLDLRLDSTAVVGISAGGGGPSTQPVPCYEYHRFINGWFHDTWRDPDWMTQDGFSQAQGNRYKPLEDFFSDLRHASVMKMHVSDLGGPGAIPSRNGWWEIKTLANFCRTTNEIAGRTVLAVVPLDALEP